MYTLSEEENMILTMVDGLCADIVSEGAADIDVADEFPEEYYNLVKEQGLIGLAMPEEFGGFAVSMHCWAKSAARMAQELPALGLTAFLPLVASHAIVAYGTDEQKQRYMPEIIMGEKKISFAVTEPNAGSDIWNLTTKAVPEGDGYVLTGNKQFISNAAVADYFCVIAKVEQDGEKLPTCFIVDATAEGVNVSSHERKLGLHASPTCPVGFDKVALGADCMVGTIGQGREIALAAINRARLGLAALGLGITKAALKAAAEYALTRKQFGGPIADMQVIEQTLADMRIAATASELMLDDAIEALETNALDAVARVAQAKAYCTEAAEAAATAAIQVHGGYGFVCDYPVERYYRDAKALTIIGGTNHVQRHAIARQVKKEYAL